MAKNRSKSLRATRTASSYGSPPPGCPMHVPVTGHAPKNVDSTDLTYNDYLKVTHLLDLQTPQSQPAHHDEMLFIVIHQSYELWFKQILHEFTSVMSYMDKGDPLSAHHFMSRIVEIMKLLVQQIHLLETMSPIDFLEFRDRLMPASGFQSTQFREIEFLVGLKDEQYLKYFKNRPEFVQLLKRRMGERDVLECYYAMMRDFGYDIPLRAAQAERSGRRRETQAILDALRPIYQKPSKHLPAYLLTEALVSFDQYLGLWREHHVRVVERIIGFRRGTGGSSGVEYLRTTTHKKAFPLLWELRSHLKKEV